MTISLLHTVLKGSGDNSILLHQPDLVTLVFPSLQPGPPLRKSSGHARPLFKVALAYPCNSWLRGETPPNIRSERPKGLLRLLGSVCFSLNEDLRASTSLLQFFGHLM